MNQETMNAAVWLGPNELVKQQTAIPKPADGWSRIKVEYAGICGTDFSILHGTHPRASAPLVMGHEIVGVVDSASAGAFRPGTRVVVEPLISCGVCSACRRGESHVCVQLKLFGIDAPGALAEWVALPNHALIPVAEHVAPSEAALAEPLAVAVHAVARSRLSGGERVAVLGAGPIGILTALVAEQAGAGQIILVEPSTARNAFAAELGFTTVSPNEDATAAILTLTDSDGADTVFDTAAHPSVAAILTDVCRVSGEIVLVGVYKKPVPVNLQAVTFKEQNLTGVRVYTRADLERAVQLIEAGSLGLDRIPLAVFSLDETEAAFEEAMSAGASLKTLVTPNPGGEL